MHSNENKLEKIRIFDGFSLKILAMLTMFIDHIGAVLFPQYIVLRLIGRLAFPIYCFLLATGAIYTKNVEKYSARLLLFALISEIPFDLAFFGRVFDRTHQNVFFTLFLGLLGIMIAKKYPKVWWMSLFMALVADFLCTDYGATGVLYILLFYFLYDRKIYQMLSFALMTQISYAGTTQMYCLFSIVPMLLYNGKRGKNIKYFFYIFYPLHLLVLYLVAKYWL